MEAIKPQALFTVGVCFLLMSAGAFVFYSAHIQTDDPIPMENVSYEVLKPISNSLQSIREDASYLETIAYPGNGVIVGTVQGLGLMDFALVGVLPGAVDVANELTDFVGAIGSPQTVYIRIVSVEQDNSFMVPSLPIGTYTVVIVACNILANPALAGTRRAATRVMLLENVEAKVLLALR